MREIVRTSITLLVVMAAVALTGCPDPVELSSTATVASVTVAGKTVTLGTPSMDWMEAKDSAKSGSVYLTSAQMSNAEVVVAKGQNGQKVFLAQALPSVMPDFDDRVTQFSFDPGDYLWVEVFSENHDDYKLYAIQVRTSTPTVLDVSLGGRSAVGGITLNGEPIKQYGTGLGAHNTDLAAAAEGEIWFGSDQAGQSLAIAAVPEDPDTIILYATGVAGAAAGSLFPSGYTNPATVTVTNGNYLYIKSVSADAVNGETVFYKLKLVAKNVDLTIGDVTIKGDNGTPVSFIPGVMGTEGFGGGENHRSGAELSGSGARNISATPVTNVTVAIGTKAPTSVIRYGRTDFFNAQEDVPSAGHKLLTYQTSNVLADIVSLDYIAVEVTNELGDKGWYAFKVGIGPSSDLATLTVNGQPVNLDEARNPTFTGLNYYVYRPGTQPADGNSDGLWDDLDLVFTGDLSGAEIAQIGVSKSLYHAQVDNNRPNIADWTDLSDFGGGSISLDDQIGTSHLVVIHLRNPDGLEYYYKVQLAYGRQEYAMSSITVNGSAATIGTPSDLDWIRNRRGPMWDGVRGVFDITNAATSFAIAATVSPGATYRYGWLVPGRDLSVVLPLNPPGSGANLPYTLYQTTDPLEMGTLVTEAQLSGGRDLVIEVSSEDKTKFTYYVVLLTRK
ncbi:hypothetical protein AGMMS4952_14370 [Spirochaetia bacterium]|nr:hypothetical protein AGMMS4952_14370 [Spirochaetia bacterium]